MGSRRVGDVPTGSCRVGDVPPRRGRPDGVLNADSPLSSSLPTASTTLPLPLPPLPSSLPLPLRLPLPRRPRPAAALPPAPLSPTTSPPSGRLRW